MAERRTVHRRPAVSPTYPRPVAPSEPVAGSVTHTRPTHLFAAVAPNALVASRPTPTRCRMATQRSQSHTPTNPERNRIEKYASCLITPMSDDSRGFHLAHVVDALLVGLLVFFAVILGDLLPALLRGQFAYLTVSEIMARIPTAAIGFGLVFVFQWLRARGVDVLAAYQRFKEALP